MRKYIHATKGSHVVSRGGHRVPIRRITVRSRITGSVGISHNQAPQQLTAPRNWEYPQCGSPLHPSPNKGHGDYMPDQAISQYLRTPHHRPKNNKKTAVSLLDSYLTDSVPERRTICNRIYGLRRAARMGWSDPGGWVPLNHITGARNGTV